MAYATYTFMDNELVGLQHDGRQRDVATDPQGSVVHLMTSFFVSSDTLSYWPYGQQRSKSGTVNIPFHYIGAYGYYEDTSNRLYVRARYYRADLGNWITKDPLWPEEPAYAYVRGNPTNYVDPSGMWTKKKGACKATIVTPGMNDRLGVVVGPGGTMITGGGAISRFRKRSENCIAINGGFFGQAPYKEGKTATPIEDVVDYEGKCYTGTKPDPARIPRLPVQTPGGSIYGRSPG